MASFVRCPVARLASMLRLVACPRFAPAATTFGARSPCGPHSVHCVHTYTRTHATYGLCAASLWQPNYSYSQGLMGYVLPPSGNLTNCAYSQGFMDGMYVLCVPESNVDLAEGREDADVGEAATYTHIHTHIYTNTYTHIYTQQTQHTTHNTHTHTYTHIHAYTHTHTHYLLPTLAPTRPKMHLQRTPQPAASHAPAKALENCPASKRPLLLDTWVFFACEMRRRPFQARH